MSVHLTPAEARRLGITESSKAKRTRKTVPVNECAPVRCVACGELFGSQAAEDRHFQTHPTHRRYEMVP